MSFLRRLLGSEAKPAVDAGDAAPHDEDAYERELLRDESKRLDDDLIQRQLRFADRSWTPPTQGGTRRADDTADE